VSPKKTKWNNVLTNKIK